MRMRCGWWALPKTAAWPSLLPTSLMSFFSLLFLQAFLHFWQWSTKHCTWLRFRFLFWISSLVHLVAAPAPANLFGQHTDMLAEHVGFKRWNKYHGKGSCKGGGCQNIGGCLIFILVVNLCLVMSNGHCPSLTWHKALCSLCSTHSVYSGLSRIFQVYSLTLHSRSFLSCKLVQSSRFICFIQDCLSVIVCYRVL